MVYEEVYKLTNEELKIRLTEILDGPVTIQVYFVLKDQHDLCIKLADIDNGESSRELKSIYINRINEDLLQNDQMSIIELSNTDERANAIYHYDLDDIPDDLNPLYNFDISNTYNTFSFANDDLKSINGYIILLGCRDKHILLYKKQYPIYLIRRDSFLMYKKDERFIKMDEDMIRMSSDFQFFKLDDELYIMNLSVLEKFFGFHKIIKREALAAIEEIDSIDILEDIEVLREATDNVTFARKLTKVRSNSPILTMDISIEKIIDFTKKTPGLKTEFKYTDDNKKIRLDTNKSKEAFVKLLNDDFLRSELTQLYYDSLAKDKLSTAMD